MNQAPLRGAKHEEAKKVTEAEAVEITAAINTGEIFKLPRHKLEKFAAALSTTNAFGHYSAHEFPTKCETVRMALSLRISEDDNKQAKRESRIALVIAIFALFAGVVQAGFAAWQYLQPQPTQVYSTQDKPVYVLPNDNQLQKIEKLSQPQRQEQQKNRKSTRDQ